MYSSAVVERLLDRQCTIIEKMYSWVRKSVSERNQNVLHFV